MKMLLSCVIGLTACDSANKRSGDRHSHPVRELIAPSIEQDKQTPRRPVQYIEALPIAYLRAFACIFDENPIAAAKRYHGTPAGRAARADDLRSLRSLGFKRESHDGDLESVGGKIAAPPGLTILGLPVSFVEINGMIGDTNSIYVTTFDKSVAVDKVAKAARLSLNRTFYDKYNMRHYSRSIESNPDISLYLDDRGGKNVLLVCNFRSTPD